MYIAGVDYKNILFVACYRLRIFVNEKIISHHATSDDRGVKKERLYQSGSGIISARDEQSLVHLLFLNYTAHFKIWRRWRTARS